MKVFLLHGGLFSADGIITSVGMNTLVSMLRKLPDVEVTTYPWANWSLAYHDIMSAQSWLPDEPEIAKTISGVSHKIALIGYSGGGMKATWVANGCIMVAGKIVYTKPPRIDLLIAYDPSPKESIQELHDNVARAICYHNNRPLMFGLGGGRLTGPNVETVEISEQHLAVQFDQGLHRRTAVYVEQAMGKL